jgi:phosphatidylglycerol:prolipoprotein diacylglycerol transferase
LGHGIGRIGCFLVGDDYGTPSDLPWACAFPKGLPPTNIPVHPTQLYEMSAYFIIFFYLRYRKRNQSFSGEIIFEYLFLGGFARFMVEFIRTNTKYAFGLSGAQYLSILMMVIGAYQLWKMRRQLTSTLNSVN